METRVPIGLTPDGKFAFKEGDKVTVRFGSTDLTGFVSTPPSFVSHGALLDELEHFRKTGSLYEVPDEFTFEWGADFPPPPPIVTATPWSDPKSDPLEDMKKVMAHFDKWPDPPPVPIAISHEDWRKVRAARRGEGVVKDPFFPDGVARSDASDEYVRVPRELMAALLESLGGTFTITVSDLRETSMQNGPRTVVIDRWVDQVQGMMYRMRVEEDHP